MTGSGDATSQHRTLGEVEVRVAARLGNLAVLRVIVAAVATHEDLDFDAVCDLKIAVDEACGRLITSAVPQATIHLVIDPRDDELVIKVSASCHTADVLMPGSFSWHVLTSLTDEVSTFQGGVVPGAPGRVFGIMMIAKRRSSR